MSEKPVRAVKLNVINEPKDSYTGGKSSLCPGCGHDQISSVIVNAAWENGIKPHRIAKMSGIGCSSKTPAYYLGQSHGFNTVHGRMPSVTTGANVVNTDLTYLGVSGDGDSASIGIGQLIHAIRRNVNMVYIVENNGVYGLTKGQYSATADVGSKKKKGAVNETQPIDLCYGNQSWMLIRSTFIQWFKEAINCNHQGSNVSQRIRFNRRNQSLCNLQQQR